MPIYNIMTMVNRFRLIRLICSGLINIMLINFIHKLSTSYFLILIYAILPLWLYSAKWEVNQTKALCESAYENRVMLDFYSP